MFKKTIVVAFVLLAVLVSFAAADTVDIKARVDVNRGRSDSCGIDLDRSSLNFGTVDDGETSSIRTVTVENTGSRRAQISLRGTDWEDVDLSRRFSVSATRYGLTFPTAALTHTSRFVFSLDENEEDDVGFDVRIPLGQPDGTYEQTITFVSSC